MQKRIALIAAMFHKEHVEQMLQEAKKTAIELNLIVTEEIQVPGCLEIPLALKRLFVKNELDGAVVLGIIERGETKHGLVMGSSVIKAIIDLELAHMKPVGIGILGPEILPNQIETRLQPYAKDAVHAVNAMLKTVVYS